MSRKNIYIIIISLLIIFISPYYFAKFIYQINKTQVNISLNQAKTSVTINGRSVEPGIIYLEPGKYVVLATLNGYGEYRTVYEIGDNKTEISINLSKKSTKTISEILTEPDGYNTVTDKYPITKRLPYNNRLLKIDYSEDSTLDSFTIVVDAHEGYRSAVVSKIKSWGYNPADYNITFKDYRNPFAL